MPPEYVQRFASVLQDSRLARPDEICGCSLAEIIDLESRFAVRFPETYRQFLRIAGRGAGLFYRGSDLFFPALGNLREYALDLLREAGSRFELTPDAFVFFMHQGYQFMYFRTNDGMADPPVYNYIEGDAAPSRAYGSFTEFLTESVEEHLRQI